MSMSDWAKREVEIACKREREDSKVPEGEWDYGCACYESALKAYESLMEDGHSGMSISITKNILVRLIEGKPLTPIEDTEDVWNELDYSTKEDVEKHYQCKRMSALFKDVYPDGTVKYSDVDRCYCVDTDNPDIAYTTGLVREIIDEMFPITMPYAPTTRSYKVVCETFLVDPKNGDYDTKGILYVIKPDGERAEIEKYFAEKNREFVEIDKDEYERRKMLSEGWKEVSDGTIATG